MGRGVKIQFQLKYGLQYDAVDIIGHLTIVLKYLLKQPFLNPFFTRDGNNIHKYGFPNGQIWFSTWPNIFTNMVFNMTIKLDLS